MQPQSTGTCDYCHQPYPFARLIRQKRQNYGKLICEPCEAERMRAHMRSAARREKNRAGWQERYARAIAQVRVYKDRPCMDCGGRFPHFVMEFDHPDPKIKTFTISQKACKGLTPAVLAEIEKCDLVCSNCHRVRTVRQIEAGILKRPGRPRLPDAPPWTGPGSLNTGDLGRSA